MATIARRSLQLAVCGQRVMSITTNCGMRYTAVPIIHRRPVSRVLHPASQSRLISTSCFHFAEAAKAVRADGSVPDVPVITYNDVRQSRGMTIIDVRKFDEVAEFGKIPDAKILPVDDIETAMKLSRDDFQTKYGFVKPSTSQPLIIYCRSGKRAERAGKILQDVFGFTNVNNYKGSWTEWAEKHPEHVKKPLPKPVQKKAATAA